jgi:hypothetical protein
MGMCLETRSQNASEIIIRLYFYRKYIRVTLTFLISGLEGSNQCSMPVPHQSAALPDSTKGTDLAANHVLHDQSERAFKAYSILSTDPLAVEISKVTGASECLLCSAPSLTMIDGVRPL